MIRMLVVGYVFAIRSERRLCAEVQVNLAYRWFCQLGIEDTVPDHSVFCRARHERFRESDALRRVFEGVVAMCITAGLVGGEAFSIDASLIEADVDKKKRVPGDQPIAWPKAEEASHAVREYLAVLDAARSTEDSDGGDGGDPGGGGSRRKPPKEVSLTDPQASPVAGFHVPVTGNENKAGCALRRSRDRRGIQCQSDGDTAQAGRLRTAFRLLSHATTSSDAAGFIGRQWCRAGGFQKTIWTPRASRSKCCSVARQKSHTPGRSVRKLGSSFAAWSGTRFQEQSFLLPNDEVLALLILPTEAMG